VLCDGALRGALQDRRDERVCRCGLACVSPTLLLPLSSSLPKGLAEHIREFVDHLRKIYRKSNSYHNFHHAVDVLQATYHFLCSAHVVPSVKILLDGKGVGGMWKARGKRGAGGLECLEVQDIFALYVAAIGHDAGHPGFTNHFMVRFLIDPSCSSC
jgi:hypothetical protein